jgi:hypothetical protein
MDAPTVAVVWALAFAWAARIHLQPWIALTLACGTWSVYVADRLLDARRAISVNKLDSLHERHYFHWRHKNLFAPLAICCAAIAAALILRLMPPVVCERNSALAAAALAYFSGVHSSARLPHWLPGIPSKELLVGVIFTTGCAAPTLWHMRTYPLPLMTCFVFFAALAWVNCFAIEQWESATRRPRVVLAALILGCVGLLFCLAFAFSHSRIAALFVAGALSAILLAILDRARTRLTPLALRTLADLVLLTPAILIALGALTA